MTQTTHYRIEVVGSPLPAYGGYDFDTAVGVLADCLRYGREAYAVAKDARDEYDSEASDRVAALALAKI